MSRIIYLFVFTAFLSVQAKFPEDPQPCKQGDADCIVKVINYFISKKATEGVREINLVKIDPLPVSKLNIKQGADSPVNIDLTFTNNNIYGLSTVKIDKIKGFGKDLAKKHEAHFTASQVSLVGPYNIKGKVLILPISGTGISNMTLVNPSVSCSFMGKRVEKNGEAYMEATNLKLQIKPERMHFDFTNLFNGDKALGDNMNVFLNENWDAIYGEVQKSIQSAFAEIFQAIITNVFSKYPYDKYFDLGV